MLQAMWENTMAGHAWPSYFPTSLMRIVSNECEIKVSCEMKIKVSSECPYKVPEELQPDVQS